MNQCSDSVRSDRVGEDDGGLAVETLAGLVARARAGEESAWGALYQRFTPALRGMALRHRLAAQEADDVVQQTWLRAVEHIDALREVQAFPGWLATTCRNESLRAIRGRNRCVSVEATEELDGARSPAWADPPADPAVAVEQRELVAMVRRALSLLPAQQAMILRGLLSLDGVRGAYTELSDALCIPVGSIGPTRRRAFQRLREDPVLHGLMTGRVEGGSHARRRAEVAAWSTVGLPLAAR